MKLYRVILGSMVLCVFLARTGYTYDVCKSPDYYLPEIAVECKKAAILERIANSLEQIHLKMQGRY